MIFNFLFSVLVASWGGCWSLSQLQVGKSGYTPELMLTIRGFGIFAQGYFSSALKYLSNFSFFLLG